MLWFLDYEITKWFLIFSFTSTLGFAIALSQLRINVLWKALAIPSIFIQFFMALLVTQSMLGKPMPGSPEFNGYVSGYSVFNDQNDDKKVAILVRQVSSDRPLTISVPWSEDLERKLGEAMQDLIKGMPTGVRRMNSEEDSFDSQGVELYNFVDGILTEKSNGS